MDLNKRRRSGSPFCYFFLFALALTTPAALHHAAKHIRTVKTTLPKKSQLSFHTNFLTGMKLNWLEFFFKQHQHLANKDA